MNERWYAVYTKPRWEKKVAQTLVTNNVTNYCPLNRVERQWSDRKKMVQEPLFTSYVFVHISEKQLNEIRKLNGIITVVSWLGRPAIIRDEEIATIRQFLMNYNNVKLKKAQFNIDDKVQVLQGSLINQQGIIVAVKNNRVKVALPSLGYEMYAFIDTSSLVKSIE